MIIGSDSEIMYFPPSFHFKKGLAKFTIEVRLIRGFRQKGAFSALSRGASYTRMRLIPEYIRYLKTQTLTYLIGSNPLNSYNYHSISLCIVVYTVVINYINI